MLPALRGSAPAQKRKKGYPLKTPNVPVPGKPPGRTEARRSFPIFSASPFEGQEKVTISFFCSWRTVQLIHHQHPVRERLCGRIADVQLDPLVGIVIAPCISDKVKGRVTGVYVYPIRGVKSVSKTVDLVTGTEYVQHIEARNRRSPCVAQLGFLLDLPEKSLHIRR